MTKTSARFGSWASPISTQLLVSEVVGLAYAFVDGDDTYWIEGRPSEGGRYVLVKRTKDGTTTDVFGPDFAARTLVHEYGGLCVAIHKGVVYFSNYADQRLYRVVPGQSPEAITPEPPSPRAWRYADPRISPDGTTLYCIRERHESDEVINDVVAIPTSGEGDAIILAGGCDFYSDLAVSPEGDRLAYVCWNHPNMPWDQTSLYEMTLREGREVVGQRLVTGDEESVQQPRYSSDGHLFYVSDRRGWWNIYRDHENGAISQFPLDAEFGQPAWVFGTSTYQPLADGSFFVTWSDTTGTKAGILHDQYVRPLDIDWSGLLTISSDGHRVVAIAIDPVKPMAVVEIDSTTGATTVIKASFRTTVDVAYLSVPEAIEFPTEHGLTAHAYYYPPTNPDFEGPEGEAPPLIVSTHGGPTSQTEALLAYSIQYWTSRGFGYVDVNYGGSTGYGREYRNRLRGQWGIVDLDDCTNAAKYLVATGRANPKALLIHGGSAGGYTTFCALTFRRDFVAGASYFGVSDLGGLASDTHKFESRYLDLMMGPWPQSRALYEARSPIFHTDLLETPMIIFQGLEDKVVPPSQAEIMVAALTAKEIPHAYIAYEGEQHGFRKAENIIRTAEAELTFYGKVLGFTPADETAPVEIAFEEKLR